MMDDIAKRERVKRLAREAIARSDADGLFELLARFGELCPFDENIAPAVEALAEHCSTIALAILDAEAAKLEAIYSELDAEDAATEAA